MNPSSNFFEVPLGAIEVRGRHVCKLTLFRLQGLNGTKMSDSKMGLFPGFMTVRDSFCHGALKLLEDKYQRSRCSGGGSYPKLM